MANRRINPAILREYDIRGIVGETLTADGAETIGRAFGTIIRRSGGQLVCVGYDGRLSSRALEAALVEGLISTGVEVARIGLGPTPMLYFATHVIGADGGIMVTGSHNPANHNGFKLVMHNRPFFGDQIAELGRLAELGDFVSPPRGRAVDRPAIFDAYLSRLLADYDGGRALTVVWDAGNGATGAMVEALAARLPGCHILLNTAIDGRFPAHHPDPTDPRNLEQLIATVIAERADLGIAFDGDGDRIGVVDPRGRILWGDQLLSLLAEEVLAARPGAQILADVKASQALFDRIKALGGKPVMCPTGHSLIKSQMADCGAPLAGEMSGHIFFADRYYGFDDALYAAIRVLRMVGRWQGVTLAQRYDGMAHPHNTPELRIPCPDDRKFAVVTQVKQVLAAAGADVCDIDGVRVTTPDGWWLLRASNTQAMLVGRCESATPQGLARLTAAFGAALHTAGVETWTDKKPKAAASA